MTEAPTVRLASYDDGPAVARLRRAWVEEQHGGQVDDDGYEAAFADWWDSEHGQRLTWLGETGGTAVGMLNVLVFTRMPRPGVAPSRWGYLANFYVEPAHRASGLGTALLAACTAYADEHGFVRIVLSPSERSVPLYERGGFRPATELMIRPRPEA